MRLRYYRYSAARGIQKIKTKTAIIITALALAISGTGGLSLAILGTAHAITPTWNVNGTYTFDFELSGSHYVHDATISGQNSAGNFTIGGGFPAGGPYAYAWNGIGNISGSALTMSVNYTVGAPGTHMDMSGTVASNGTLSGTWTDNFGGTRSGTWTSATGSAHAISASTVVVTQNDLDNTSSNPAVVRADGKNKWFMYNDTTDVIDNTLGSFVFGPSAPPHGVGSVQFTLGANPNDRKNIATYQFAGTKLADITELSYVAYSHSGVAGPTESPYLNFNVDFNNLGTFQRRLVYVPSANGPVPQDTWNTYDTINGGNALWTWSGFVSNGNKWPDGNTNQYRTWSSIKAAFPNIAVLATDSWLGVRVGEPGPTGYTGNVDALTFGTASTTKTFDFEATNRPSDEKDCKHDGWKNFNAPVFSNQGQCIKWVDAEAHGDLRMSGPSQRIKFNVANEKEEGHHHKHQKNTVEYWNFDYPGGLHYKADVTCTSVNPQSKDARFMFQIPSGHPGLSGLYVVAYVKEVNGKHNPDLYGHAATADLATATQWCQTGVGFAPTMYPVTKGNVEVE